MRKRQKVRERREMYSRHGYLSNSPHHSQDLLKYSNIKKRCFCLRGSTKLTNCFGPWDHLALEIPPGNTNSRHVSNGKFLLSDLKQSAATQRKILPSLVKCPKRGSTVSLGYLSRSCTASENHCKFRHFATVAEHIRHYRENKPNSLYEPAEEDQETSTLGEDGDGICRCLYCNSSDGNTSGKRDSQPTKEPCTCTEHSLYCPTPPHPLKATGKAVLPTHPNIPVPPPSLEDMSDTYWVPINAVIQKRQVTATLYNSMGYYDHLSVKFPSLRKKPFGEEFPQRRKLVARKKVDPDAYGELLYKDNTLQSEKSGQSEKVCTCSRVEVSTTTHRPFAGPGRLLSGKLMPTLPNHQESRDNLVIGIKKSTLSDHPDCDMVVGTRKSPPHGSTLTLNSTSNLSISARKSFHATTTATDVKRKDSLDGSTAGPIAVRMPGSSAKQSRRIVSSKPKLQSPEPPEPNPNELNITCENCRRERLLEDTVILDSPIISSSPVQLNLTTNRETERRLSSRFHRDNLYKPTNVSITFKKPMKLFRVRSVQKKMLQHDHSKQQKDATNNTYHQPKETKTSRQRRMKSSRHRSALNRREGSAHVEGVFGTQNHHAISCVLRSRERQKRNLETVNYSHHQVAAEITNKTAAKTTLRIYLIKTKRPLEDILPELSSEQKHSQDDKEVSIDMYGE